MSTQRGKHAVLSPARTRASHGGESPAGQLKAIRAQRWRKGVKDEKTDQHDEAARLITAKQRLLVKPEGEIEKRGPRGAWTACRRRRMGANEGTEELPQVLAHRGRPPV